MSIEKCEMDKIPKISVDEPLFKYVMLYTPMYSISELKVWFGIKSNWDWKTYTVYKGSSYVGADETWKVDSFEDALQKVIKLIPSEGEIKDLKASPVKFNSCAKKENVIGVTPWYTFHPDDSPVRYLLMTWGKDTYATIMQGHRVDNSEAFFYGHYDYTFYRALKDFTERWMKEIRFDAKEPRSNLLDNPRNRKSFIEKKTD